MPAAFAVALATAPAWGQGFVNFESDQVRPLALSPDGSQLFAVNTPDNELEIFAVGGGTLTRLGSVPVGLEPVAVAARSNTEVWVVNHLSDSVSVVDLSTTPPRVTRTIQTCDEPRDIVFAGPGNARAFITAARRGQNCSITADLTTPGIGRAVVQVYDAASLGNGLNGNLLTTIVLFGDTPRALARSTDGNTVYAAVFQSGNQTTTVNEGNVCDGGFGAGACTVSGGRTAPGGLPWPNVNFENILGPETGLIVKLNLGSGHWEDQLGRDWSDVVRFQLPDLDVFTIDASAAVPVETTNFAHVGTVLFNMAVNPITGKVYVSNTEARNEVRFEGPGVFAGTAGLTVQGHLHEARITVLDGGTPLPRRLNKHIDYSERPAPPGVKDRSLATPTGMAISSDGTTLYVAAYGSSKVGVFDTGELETDTFVPDSASHIPVSGGGPSGLVLDEASQRLYVMTRFDDSVAVINTTTRSEVDHLPLHTPEPADVVQGRRFLFDAYSTSSNGEASCSSCHVSGDFDSLAWDLGNPDEVVVNNPLPVKIPGPPPTFDNFHPLKGPMTTQTLRGMANHGSMHWRGDRTGGNDPGGSAADEDAAFKKFNVAFPGLLGRDDELTDAEMQAFTDYALTLTDPPNPIRRLDGVLSGQQASGQALYNGPNTDVLFNCNGCHVLNPSTGNFGTDGSTTFEGETQMFKVPQLRNLYAKVGMFGRPQDADTGPQIRGFGFLHDGSVDTVFNFLSASVFTLTNAQQRQLEQFVFAYDSNLAPSVGQQTTLTSTSNTNVGDRITLLEQRADLGECQVIVKGTVASEARGGYRLADGSFRMDRVHDAPLSDAAVRAFALTPGQEMTFTCVPPGAAQRLGIDRDGDGYFDRDELDLGTDPADAADFPGSGAISIRASSFKLRDDVRAPIDPDRTTLTFRSAKYQGSASGVAVPAWGGGGDPTLSGATLLVYRGDGTAIVSIAMPAAHWTRIGSASKPGYKYRDKDRTDGPITLATLRNGKLVLKGKGPGMYQLDNAPQDSMVLRLQLGDTSFCAAAPAATPAESNDALDAFNGVKQSPPPLTCPALPI